MSVPTKKKLTVSQAAHQWVRVKRRMAELKPELEEAAEVLVEHFQRTGRNAYKDLIGFSESTSSVLDQPKVRAFLGKKLPQFQKTITKRSLSLLGSKDGKKP